MYLQTSSSNLPLEISGLRMENIVRQVLTNTQVSLTKEAMGFGNVLNATLASNIKPNSGWTNLSFYS